MNFQIPNLVWSKKKKQDRKKQEHVTFDFKPQTTAKSRNFPSPKRLIEKITSRNCSKRIPFLSPCEGYAWTKPEALEILAAEREKAGEIRIEGRGTRTTVPGMQAAGEAKSEAAETKTEREVGEPAVLSLEIESRRDPSVWWCPRLMASRLDPKKRQPLACLAR